jgi:hypothetical protein
VRNGSLRASDADRERVAGRLRDHAVAGRLTTEELDERSGQAFAARTLGELYKLLADLPRDRRRGPAPATAAILLLAEGVLWVLVGVIIVTIAILWVLARAGAQLARLAAAAAGNSLDSGGAPALRRGFENPRSSSIGSWRRAARSARPAR